MDMYGHDPPHGKFTLKCERRKRLIARTKFPFWVHFFFLFPTKFHYFHMHIHFVLGRVGKVLGWHRVESVSEVFLLL